MKRLLNKLRAVLQNNTKAYQQYLKAECPKEYRRMQKEQLEIDRIRFGEWR